MNFVAPDFMPVLPEIFVLTLTCLILVIDVFLEQRQRHITYGLAQLTLLGAALLTLLTYSQAPVTTTQPVPTQAPATPAAPATTQAPITTQARK